MLDLQNTQFLTKAEIKERAASVFTTQGAESTSDKYTHIPTDRIIDDMQLLGWGVVDAKQVKARKGIGYQKHLLVFRNNDVVINGEDGDTVFPQILLTNSHDGKNAFTFTAGLFRMVCENNKPSRLLKRHWKLDSEPIPIISRLISRISLPQPAMRIKAMTCGAYLTSFRKN